jgi:predicted ATPase/DNA-binding winged helix-turn-helix (wHTH) protein
LTKIYEIGPYRLDAEAAVLTQAGVPVALGSRAVAVLTTLVERSNEYVQKGAIMDAAWPGVVVEESNLAVQISAIRRVLAQAPGGEHWIETLARRGYRFVGPATELRDEGSTHAASEHRRSNLPEPLTSFVGRERELVEIKRLLPGARLVTLVGMGGIGKTRLALQVAAEVLDAYRDGVWLIELASIADPVLVPTAAAQVLGVQQRAGTSMTTVLGEHLRAHQTLLVLDNCEHLADACATLADAILRRASQAMIIATSREPLQVAGEQIYALHSLSLPDRMASADAIGRSEAVQLFVERARRQQPDFDSTGARTSAIAELCIHLDGIPLALELAAARIRSFSVEQILARIDDRFRLLTHGSRAALPRQQTLRATLDWSYDLLAEDERVLLRRLAVFPGSFSLEAASAVASDPTIDGNAVIDALSQLVGRSLVIADTNDSGVRYRLLETTRAYALDKLAEAEDGGALKRRHARYFRNLFECAPDDWERLPDAEWRAQYQPELDNVRAALDWAFGSGGDPAIGVELSGAAGELWYWLALEHEGQQRLEAAVASVGSQTSELDQARLWRWLGEMWAMERPTQAVVAYERAIEFHRRVGDGSVPGHLFVWLGELLTLMGRVEQAVSVLAEAFSALERKGTQKTWGHYFLFSGFVKTMTGDLAAARIDYERGVSLARSTGAERLMLGGLTFLADLAWEAGDLDMAFAGFREAAALIRNRAMTPKGLLGLCLTNLAGIHTERGELDEALAAAREGLPLRKEEGYSWGAFDHLALRAALAGKTASAARLAGYADAAYAAKATPRQANETRARDRLQTLLRETSAPDELERLLAEGATMSEEEAVELALED